MAHLIGLTILLSFAAACIVVVGTLTLIYGLRRPQRQTYASALARRLPTCPADLDLVSTDGQVAFRDGTTTPVWIVDGDGPADTAIVISHGFAESRYQALDRAAWLKRWASKLVVYDLRAHGESTAKRSGLGAIEAADLIELIGQLDLPERVVLYGCSLGGSVSIAAAARLQDDASGRIKAVVAEAPFRHPLEPIKAHRRRNRYPVFPFVPLAWGHVAVRMWKHRPFDRVQHAALLRCPLLVLHGTDDLLCPFDSAREIADAATKGTIVAFEGAGHMDLIEHDRPKYLEAIGRFLDGRGDAKEVGDVDTGPTH